MNKRSRLICRSSASRVLPSCPVLSSLCYLSSSFVPIILPSFPTRRSSDLQPEGKIRQPGSRGSLRRFAVALLVPAVELAGRNFAEELKLDRKSTRLNSSHLGISYAVFCLKKKKRDGVDVHEQEVAAHLPFQRFSRAAILSCPLVPLLSFIILRPHHPTLFPYTTLFRSPARGENSAAWFPRLAPPLRGRAARSSGRAGRPQLRGRVEIRSEEHTSELQSLRHLVCRLLLEKKKKGRRRRP